MKKLFLMTMVLLAAAACSKDETTGPAAPGGPDAIEPPHFYGMATLDNEAPQTRGVANKRKLWPSSMAAENLTVKFLNGIPNYRKFVKEVASEWEKAAGVRFFFVDDDQDAEIRIGFDYVRGMKTSWSYTGIDIDDLYDLQDEPTMHFAEWRRISDEKRRSDVLRAFGQTLGLELEYRHPMLDPGWIRNDDGTLNEAEIQRYWEDELAGFISWEELKKMVLDPINANPRNIASTPLYDRHSVMNWPFFDEIAATQRPIETDADYKTELSEEDKKFIKELYGESFNGMPVDDGYLPLVEFDYIGTAPSFSVTTSKRLVVIWDNEAKECSYVDLPTDTTTLHNAAVSHSYSDSKRRKIIIGEMLEYGQEMPQTSTALKEFNFYVASGSENIIFSDKNIALEKLYINGGENFKSQTINLEARNCFKQIHLMRTWASNAMLDNCQNLEIIANTPSIWKPTVSGPQIATLKQPIKDGYFEIDGPVIIEPGRPIFNVWPRVPIQEKSLDTLDIQNCPKIRVISLDNTLTKKLELKDHNDLEYIYLSSFPDYIVGGGTNNKGDYLRQTLNDLPIRTGRSMGLIVIRGLKYDIPTIKPSEQAEEGMITRQFPTIYAPVQITRINFLSINAILRAKNWQIVWDSGLQVIN